jgi:diadenylate cyclase
MVLVNCDGGINMTFDLILSTVKKIIDVALVWLVFYFVFKNIRNSVKMTLLFKGIVFILLIKLISDWLGLVTIGLLLEYVIMWGPLALIIIFQPEIRNVLEQIGKTQLLGRHKVLTVDEREKLVYEITQAIDYMKKAKIGALIVIERDVSLMDYIERAKNDRSAGARPFSHRIPAAAPPAPGCHSAQRHAAQ